jgi:hypothetical protein
MPFAGLTLNFSPIPWIAPPPLGKVTAALRTDFVEPNRPAWPIHYSLVTCLFIHGDTKRRTRRLTSICVVTSRTLKTNQQFVRSGRAVTCLEPPQGFGDATHDSPSSGRN